jgi:hypothetical protein
MSTARIVANRFVEGVDRALTVLGMRLGERCNSGF